MSQQLDLLDLRTDHSLLREFRGGDQQAATELYLRYATRIRSLLQKRCSAHLAQRVDPDDILQSVFRSFFDGASQGHYDVPRGTELWSLLLVIALNKLKKEEAHHRTEKRDVARTQELPAGFSEECKHDWAYVQMQLTVEEALEKLPARSRALMELRLQGYEVAEIAEQAGRSKRSVERCLQDVRAYLKSLLEEGNNE